MPPVVGELVVETGVTGVEEVDAGRVVDDVLTPGVVLTGVVALQPETPPLVIPNQASSMDSWIGTV